MEPLDLLVACVEKLGGDEIEIARADTVNFSLCDIGAFAYVQKGGRLRGSVFIDPAVPESEMAEAVEWAEAQSVHACRVDAAWASDVDADGGFIRLLFERDLDPEAIAADDPLATEADILAGSWYGEEPHQLSRVAVPLRASDPTRLAPTNAWLLMGRQRSYPTQADISEMNRDATLGIYENFWTAAKQTEPGDLLFFYFMDPHKAVHFVARAVDHAYFDDMGTIEEGWRGRQWWTHISPMVEIEPIPVGALRRVMGDMVMAGRSGRYVRPEHAALLAAGARAKDPRDSSLLERVLQPVVGRADHPDPTRLSLTQWRQIAAGSLSLEADVERLLVEPLLRMAFAAEPDVTVRKAYRIGSRIADYVLLEGSRPVCAVEVKQRIRKSPSGAWTGCKDFMQAAGYGQSLGTPAILMDAFNTYLIPRGASEPLLALRRSVFRDEDLRTLKSFVLRGGE